MSGIGRFNKVIHIATWVVDPHEERKLSDFRLCIIGGQIFGLNCVLR